MNPTEVSMETWEQLEPSQETVHLKLLKLMHFSNYNCKSHNPYLKHSAHS